MGRRHTPCNPYLAQEFCLVKNFPTENCLRQRRFLRRSQQNGFAAASWSRHFRFAKTVCDRPVFFGVHFFAVPKRVDLNFDKNISVLSSENHNLLSLCLCSCGNLCNHLCYCRLPCSVIFHVQRFKHIPCTV